MLDVAKVKTGRSKGKPSKKNAIVRYLRGTRAELRKVHWPTREEAWNLTKIVITVTVSFAVLLGLLDYLFSRELRGIMRGDAVALGVLIVVLVAGVLAAVVLGRQAAR